MNKLRLFLAVLASVMSIHAFSTDFTVDGINYYLSIIDGEYYARAKGCSPEMTVVSIPQFVTYEGKEYPVISVHGFYNNTRIE